MGRKKQSMKTEFACISNMSWGEREKADTDLEFSFWFSVAVLMYSPLLHVWCETPFQESQLSAIFTLQYLIFDFYFCLVLEGWTASFPVVPQLHRRLGTTDFFLVIFNYCSHSPVTGWPTMSALAWLLRGQPAIL